MVIYAALSALCQVTLTLISLPLAQMYFGEVGRLPIYIIGLTYLCISVGELNQKPISRIISFFVGTIFLIFAAIIYIDPTLPIVNAPLRYAISALFIFSFYVTGRLLISTLYSFKDFKRNYFWLNIFAAIAVVLICTLMNLAGHTGALFFVGTGIITLSIAVKSNNPQQNCKKKDIKLSTPTALTCTLGIVSGGFVSIYFEGIKTLLYPTGIEFPIYLLMSFSYLSIVSKTSSRLSSFFPRSTITTFYGAIFSIILWTIVLQILPAYSIANFFSQNDIGYLGLTFLFTALLYIPYVLFAAILPLREQESKSENHLLWNSVGNLLGFFIFTLLISDFSFIFKIIVLLVAALTAIALDPVATQSIGVKKLLLTRLAPLILIFLSLPNLEDRFVKYNVMFRELLFGNRPFQGILKDLRIEKTVRRQGQFSAISSYLGRIYLNLNGYNAIGAAPNRTGLDYSRGKLATQLLKSKPSKVLVLGLGNHIVVRELLKLKNSSQELQIDVIDNFSPYEDLDFRNHLSAKVGFSWPVESLNYINGDALNFLLTSNEKYDAIISNLTYWSFGINQKIFSKEFFKTIKNQLNPDGFFITNLLGHKVFDCSVFQAFKNNYYAKFTKFSAIIISSESEMNLDSNYIHPSFCSDTPTVELNHPYNPISSMKLRPDLSSYSFYFDHQSSRGNLGFLYKLRENKNLFQFYGRTGYKWRHFEQASKLFEKNHRIMELPNRKPVRSDTNAEDLADTFFDTDSRVSKNSICMTPGISAGQIEIVDRLKKGVSVKACSPVVDYGAALKEINRVIPTLSFFPDILDYMKGLPEILTKLGPINRVVILLQKNAVYMDRLSDWISERYQQAEIFEYEGVVLYNSIVEKLNKMQLNKNDVIFFLTSTPKKIPLNEVQNINQPLKIHAYGFDTKKKRIEHKPNSLHVRFWDQNLMYSKGSPYSNCDFVENYRSTFREPPDFHAAYMYAALQGLAFYGFNKNEISPLNWKMDSVPTIIGNYRWNKLGVPKRLDPFYFYVDENKKETLLNPQGTSFCDSQ